MRRMRRASGYYHAGPHQVQAPSTIETSNKGRDKEIAEIPLTKGRVALVDDEDYERLVGMGKWCYDGHGYAVKNKYFLTGKSGHLQMHRVIAGTPPGKLTDHINGDRLDNRKANLRIVDAAENVMNTRRRRLGLYSGYSLTENGTYAVRFRNKYIGKFDCEGLAAQVYEMLLNGELDCEPIYCRKGYEKKRGKYQVRIKSGGHRTTIGVFETEEEAHSVYFSIKDQLEGQET